MGLLDELKEAYASMNGCRDGYRELLSCATKEDLIAYYKRGYQWCLEHGVPDIDVIKREFPEYDDGNIFVGKRFNGETIKVQTAILHNCTGMLNVEMDYEDAVIPMLYFANGCDIQVVCRQKNEPPIKVPLYIFGENSIDAKDTEDIIFNRYYHNVHK